MFNFDLALDIDEGLLSRADDLALELEQEITERLGVAVSEVRIEDDGSVGFSVEAADAVAQEKVLADLRAALVDGGTIGGFDVVAVVALHPPSPPPPSPPPCVTEGGMVLSEDAVAGATTLEVKAHLCSLSLPQLLEINRGGASAEIVTVLATGSLLLDEPGTQFAHTAGESVKLLLPPPPPSAPPRPPTLPAPPATPPTPTPTPPLELDDEDLFSLSADGPLGLGTGAFIAIVGGAALALCLCLLVALCCCCCRKHSKRGAPAHDLLKEHSRGGSIVKVDFYDVTPPAAPPAYATCGRIFGDASSQYSQSHGSLGSPRVIKAGDVAPFALPHQGGGYAEPSGVEAPHYDASAFVEPPPPPPAPPAAPYAPTMAKADSVWAGAALLPPGWQSHSSEEGEYYHNVETGETSWERPTSQRLSGVI